ncbi:MAG: prepilin-type cleavage/methylation domain-containing protein [Burkholderiales bacterium]|nr:prepilin-type cleavage/methylation domain-containing protein [Burkholderiales bacterium]
MRGRIPAALAELSNSRVAMEQYFADNRAYVNTSAGTNACQAARLGSDRSLKEGFTVTCAVTATTYTITATGTSGRVNGFIYTINQDGTKATTGVPAHSGWITKTSCWVIKKDGSC